MRLLCPDFVFDGYQAVGPARLRALGVRLLLADLDYTLAPKREKEPDEAVRRWFDELHEAGITLLVLSNNRHPGRTKRFCDALSIPFISHAGKPLPRSFARAMRRCGASRAETAMLGDKLLTDTLGAHLCGIPMLMVEPVGGAASAWQKVLHAAQEPFKRHAGRDERTK